MSEYRLPIPTAAPDNVVAKLPPVFRVQSISRLPLDNHCVLNRAGLFHERASLMVEWPSRKVDVRLGAGCLVSIRWLGRPVSLGGAVRISRLVVLGRPEASLDLFQTIPTVWVKERTLVRRASALWQRLPVHFQHLFNAIFWDSRRLHRYLVGASSLKGHHSCVHGNLWHTLEVAEQALRMAQGQPLACPEVLLMAALLHDAGKADEYRLGYSGLELTTRGKLVGHRNTIIEWIAAAIAHARIALPESHYLGLIHALTSARGAPDWLGLREPCTLDAVLLSAADRLSGQIELMARHSPAEAGFGRFHPHLRGRPYVVGAAF
ncbi:HD domain-containing protein [Thauera sp. SWB20]|uniref:HD domain-containing protein n=1 Tax=Thauera sp. SWB20 TaxID=1572758 RepID=UPI0005ADDAF1|nr:HD domain-containing protein [Thauera sp. SWB20]KIN92018.1 HD domain protein [Thauera sp. SWB20]